MTGVRDVVKDIENRKNAGGDGSRRLWFKIEDGESAIVRFLEQGDDVKWSWCHEVPVPGQQWGRPVPCRDQDEEGQRFGEPCPGCERQLKRKFQGWINVIWRNAKVYAKDENGRFKKDGNGNLVVTGHADQIAVWQAGIMTFEELDGKDVTYKGLTSRDFRVTRRGTKMSTKYNIEPADPDAGPQPLSQPDLKLAGEKYDFTPDVTPQTYDAWGQQEEKKEEQMVPADTSPFMKRA